MAKKLLKDEQGNIPAKTVRKRVASLIPSPENQELYRPVDGDRQIDNLMERIKRNGCDPLTITIDNFIVSGHRRHEALERLGQQFVECRVIAKRRRDFTKSEFIQLLVDYNEQRRKSIAEQIREEMVNIDPEQAYQSLCDQRRKSIYAPESNGIEMLAIEGTKKRYKISDDKAEHVRYVKQVVFNDRRDYWPLSVRGVHYPLLNYSFVRGYYWPRRNEVDHGTRRTLMYQNDDGSYDATSELITRLRLNGEIPWEAFDDFTRPLKEYHAFDDARQFVKQEVDKLFTGYWRKLQRSQPNHVEVVVEKNTVYHMVLSVTEKYHIPTLSGRGFNSIDPWHDLHQRFQRSKKKRLIVIVISDYDPEGEMIPQVGGRTLRDDFGTPVEIIKAGVTREQIEKYKLPPQNFAKESSSNYNWFVERNKGDDSVYELEALEPEAMLNDLDSIIRSVIDIEIFNREVEMEKSEAHELEAMTRQGKKLLQGLVM